MSVNSGKIREHMEVIGSDRRHVGTVDHVEGDSVKLAKSDSPDGQHHYLDLSCCDHIEGNKVVLNETCEEARSTWR
jgi:hypothetical protein